MRFGKLILVPSIVVLLWVVFQMIHYLSKEEYIIECFTDNIIREKQDGSTSHTVDLPLTTTYSCKNFCGPNARCAITGQQCLSDSDCPGCQPKTSSSSKKTKEVPGANDAGKLTVGVTPQYSSLTSGYGTHKKIITKDRYGQPAQADFGLNTWEKDFEEGKNLFNKRYKTKQLEYMPNYPPMYSVTGEFVTEGPLPANY